MSLDAWTYQTGNSTKWGDDGIGDHAYRELKDSGRAQFSSNNSNAERNFIIDYDQVDDFVRDLLGWAKWTGTALQRVLPDRHPFFINQYATSASVELTGQPDFDDVENFIKKDFWIVRATYEPVLYYVKADNQVTAESQRFCSKKYQTQTQLLTSSSGFKFEGSGKSLAQQPAIKVNNLQLQLTWHLVPSKDGDPFSIPVEDKILALQAKVNSVTFLGYEPGTVLFLGCDPQASKPKVPNPTGDTTGLYSWDITFVFGIRNEGVSIYGERIGWQYSFDHTFPVPANSLLPGRWDRLRSVVPPPKGNLPAITADLNALFSIA